MYSYINMKKNNTHVLNRLLTSEEGERKKRERMDVSF